GLHQQKSSLSADSTVSYDSPVIEGHPEPRFACIRDFADKSRAP
ncbi:MAG: hypothetical protein ACI82O_004293, partial [Patiriisocius sp.]